MQQEFDIPSFSSDHDALVAMYVELRQLRRDIQDSNDTQKQKLIDHETRLRRIEYLGALAVGAMYAIEFYLNFIKK